MESIGTKYTGKYAKKFLENMQKRFERGGGKLIVGQSRTPYMVTLLPPNTDERCPLICIAEKLHVVHKGQALDDKNVQHVISVGKLIDGVVQSCFTFQVIEGEHSMGFVMDEKSSQFDKRIEGIYRSNLSAWDSLMVYLPTFVKIFELQKCHCGSLRLDFRYWSGDELKSKVIECIDVRLIENEEIIGQGNGIMDPDALIVKVYDVYMTQRSGAVLRMKIKTKESMFSNVRQVFTGSFRGGDCNWGFSFQEYGPVKELEAEPI